MIFFSFKPLSTCILYVQAVWKFSDIIYIKLFYSYLRSTYSSIKEKWKKKQKKTLQLLRILLRVCLFFNNLLYNFSKFQTVHLVCKSLS